MTAIDLDAMLAAADDAMNTIGDAGRHIGSGDSQALAASVTALVGEVKRLRALLGEAKEALDATSLGYDDQLEVRLDAALRGAP